jgi:prepilin-type N-terminal cleavage/methylation domain-containing protein
MNRPRVQGRQAFTLIELLVVIGIVTILIGLLLPAIQQVRESANLTQCSNNLKQMGVASQAFNDTHGFLPSSRIMDNWASWAVQLLPFLEEERLYHQWDLTLQYYQQTPAARTTGVRTYLCPSRRVSPMVSTSGDSSDSGGFGPTPGACGDYAGNAGDWSNFGDWYDFPTANGTIIASQAELTGNVHNWVGSVKLSDLTRGQSNTLLFGEKHIPTGMLQKGSSNSGGARPDGSIYNGGWGVQFVKLAGPGFPLAPNPQYTGASWQLLFGSWHPSGCQFVYGDGSVHTLPSDTNTKVLQMLSVRNCLPNDPDPF